MTIQNNATSNKLTLNTSQWQGKIININIRSEQRRLMRSQNITQAKDQLTFEVVNYKAGWYVLVVNTKRGKFISL